MKPPKRKSSIAKRTIRIGGLKTSITLEDHFFEALKEIATERGTSLQGLVTSIDPDRREPNLASKIRVFVLEHYRDQIAARTLSP